MSNQDKQPIAASDVALILAGKEAGAIDPGDMPALVAQSDGTAAERVAALKATKPHLFQPKQAKDMTPGEYDSSLRKLGVHPKSIRRNT
jgi:hypothetical protein